MKWTDINIYQLRLAPFHCYLSRGPVLQWKLFGILVSSFPSYASSVLWSQWSKEQQYQRQILITFGRQPDHPVPHGSPNQRQFPAVYLECERSYLSYVSPISRCFVLGFVWQPYHLLRAYVDADIFLINTYLVCIGTILLNSTYHYSQWMNIIEFC